MRSSIAVLVVWILAAPFALAMDPPAAKEYVIKLERPEKVGDQLEVSASGMIRESTKASVGGKVVQKTDLAIDFEVQGTYDTLAADEKGRCTKCSLTVAKMVKIEDGKEVELLAPGKVVIAETKGQETDLQLKDPTDMLSEEAKKILDVSDLLSTHTGELADDDAIFGSSRPRKVGDSWDMNTELAARYFGRTLGAVKKEHFKGKMKLVGVTKVRGTECLEIHGVVTVSPFPLPPGMPPGAKVVEGKLVMSTKSLLPVDLALPSLGVEMTADGNIVLTIPGAEPGTEVKAQTSQVRKVKTSVTPKVKKKEE